MQDTASSPIAAWSNFYVITGSSAAALTGLMFVVITLVAGDRSRRTYEGTATFSTPTVLHFCAALLVSAILLLWAPTETLFALAGANVLLIFIGIHNAWDVVTYIAVEYEAEPSDSNTSEDQRRGSAQDP